MKNVRKHGTSALARTNTAVCCSIEFMKGLDRNLVGLLGELEYAPSYEGSTVATVTRGLELMSAIVFFG